MKNIAQKENTTTASQMFPTGSLSKFIGEGGNKDGGSVNGTDKADPTQLPFTQKDPVSLKTLGSP